MCWEFFLFSPFPYCFYLSAAGSSVGFASRGARASQQCGVRRHASTVWRRWRTQRGARSANVGGGGCSSSASQRGFGCGPPGGATPSPDSSPCHTKQAPESKLGGRPAPGSVAAQREQVHTDQWRAPLVWTASCAGAIAAVGCKSYGCQFL